MAHCNIADDSHTNYKSENSSFSALKSLYPLCSLNFNHNKNHKPIAKNLDVYHIKIPNRSFRLTGSSKNRIIKKSIYLFNNMIMCDVLQQNLYGKYKNKMRYVD